MAKTATKSKRGKKKVEEPEEVEELELDEDEVEDEDAEDADDEETDEEVEEKPKPKRKRKDDPKFGARELAEYLSEQTGKEYSPRTVRVLLRKMAKDGRINRGEEEARSRYSWSGPKDPEVKKILKAVKGGEIEKSRDEALQALKDRNKTKKSASKKGTSTKGKGTKKKKAAPPPEEELDEDLELEDDEELEDEE